MTKLLRGSFAALLLAAVALVQAQTVTLTASPTTGLSPLAVTLTWSATGFTSPATCTASGSWSGTKALSGSTTLTLNGGSYSYKLDCASTTGSATLDWTAPTQNEDGSTISATPPGALAGFKLYTATSAAAVQSATPVVINDKTARSYVMSGLPVGTNYFAAKAFNTEAIESVFTGNVSTVIVAPASSATAAVTVNVQPKPPVLTVVATTAYDIQLHPIEGTRLARNVGTVPLGTECLGEPIVQSFGGTYYEVPLEAVALSKAPKTVVVARCDLSG